jgi:hypothetical protein
VPALPAQLYFATNNYRPAITARRPNRCPTENNGSLLLIEFFQCLIQLLLYGGTLAADDQRDLGNRTLLTLAFGFISNALLFVFFPFRSRLCYCLRCAG